MKKIYIFFAGLFLLVVQLKAQAPNALNFQGVARSTTGIVLPNQLISLRFTIHQGSATGATVYRETQSVTTTNLGIFTVGVGSGTATVGTFAGIGWTTNKEFLQVEMDPLGGTAYLDMGTNQYMSVPYALSAGSSTSEWRLAGNANTTPGTNFVGTTGTNDLALKANNAQGIRVSNASANVGIGAAATPNAGAELDINSTTEGFLMPRIATNPVSPAQGMIYYNTTIGCVLYYTGTAWNPMPCPCTTTPSTPGPIVSSNGGLNFCASQAGVIYSVAPVAGVTTYTWAIPGATINSGAGSNVISVTFGTTATYALTLIESNSCGTSPTLSATLTKGTGGAVITTQPVNTGATPTSNAVFTVVSGGTGGGATYQWQVSPTGTGGTFTNVTNAGVYSGATTLTLTITNPPISMNGYAYKVILTPTCAPLTAVPSNAVTLSVCNGATPSVPIILTNTQTSVTSANLAVQLGINFSLYEAYENPNLNNIQFSTGPHGTGTPLYAWIENGSSASTMPATIPTSSSTAATVWVNLGTNTIAASSGTLTIYMSFASSPVMTSTTSFTGMAPQITPTYGQYDNGALVFSFYDNFAGTSLSGKWTSFSSGTIATTVNNGLTIQTFAAQATSVITSASNYPAPIIAENYALNNGLVTAIRSYEPGLTGATAAGEGLNVDDDVSTLGYMSISDGRAGGALGNCFALQFNGSATNDAATSASPAGYIVWGLSYTGGTGTDAWTKNYTNLTTSATDDPSGSLYLALGFGTYGLETTAISYTWARLRVYPPAGVMPTAAIGVFGCY